MNVFKGLDTNKESRTLNKDTADLLETNLHKILARRIQEGQVINQLINKSINQSIKKN